MCKFLMSTRIDQTYINIEGNINKLLKSPRSIHPHKYQKHSQFLWKCLGEYIPHILDSFPQ